jgi:hypothetical protein
VLLVLTNTLFPTTDPGFLLREHPDRDLPETPAVR